MRVLVTGGAGFIGGHVVERLAARGDDVVVLDSLTAHERPPAHLPDSVELIVGDLADAEVLERAVEGVDAVCHQAARVGLGVDFDDVADYVADNDGGTANLLRALWRRSFAGRLVIASSMVVYGEGRYRCPEHGDVRAEPRRAADLDAGRFEPGCPRCGADLAWAPVFEDARLDPRNVYAATKVHTEHLAFLYGRESGARVCALRYHNVYGPRMPRDTPYAGVASVFRSALEAGKAPRVFEDGAQTRDFVHVDDVARANLLALDGAWEGACNVASGEPRSVGDMARALAAAMPGAPEPVVTGEYRLGDVRHVVASPDLAAEALGFRAETGFAEGMAAFAHAPLR
ncbi:NAD-dependent epimerase/dehydratase family protein [Glycomyces sp. TRM65418]|uniref:NAD-dependent epimerase/dehydratase family protein n=1 Tax=Glycomyces sp. TRM65418 TaxID=2867006 RepID=UPI001CE66E95|nr:NAD-dependent epimerase/dehydratase family protein [Glycomyces sp. TRM65418]MCC3761954.1 NAD-dependent epimerase/dehydratase family protein [Glycomyces sp. TRM65418]QZD56032.1 NAD-dependent epimerase/dehydratase family protein [Glycomyces sp. TRM65418]